MDRFLFEPEQEVLYFGDSVFPGKAQRDGGDQVSGRIISVV